MQEASIEVAPAIDLGSYAPADAERLHPLFAATLPPEREAHVDLQARRLLGAIRAQRGSVGAVEALLREYSLSTQEGLAVMVLAEALLRVPDMATADRLVEDVLARGGFADHATRGDAFLVAASSWTLGVSARIVQSGRDAGGRPGIAGQAHRPARRARGGAGGDAGHGRAFRARSNDRRGAEPRGQSPGTRVTATASTCWGKAPAPRRTPHATPPAMPPPSKRSAAPPATGRCRTGPASRSSCRRCTRATRRSAARRVMAELVPVVIRLARAARSHNLNFTVDAEEQDRLELSLDVIAAVAADAALAGWDGFGLAIQAYGKRALAVVRLDRRPGRDGSTAASWFGWSRAPTGIPRSSARRSAGWMAIPYSRARRPPTWSIWRPRNGCWRCGRACIRNSQPITR